MDALFTSAAAPACRSISVAQVIVQHYPPLIQIQKRYTAKLFGLTLEVESGIDQWTASVVDLGTNRILHAVHRLSAPAAKSAVVEFALFEGARTEEVAKNLKWIEHW